MGGHSRGDLASGLIIESLSHIGKSDSAASLLAACEQRLLEANSRIRGIAQHSGEEVIGATIAVLLIHDDDYACIWAGDSRVYVVHDGTIEQISRDHTEVAEMLANGALTEAQARDWPLRNVVTRAIGVRDDPELEMKSGALQSGDAFVICSDGLTAHVSDREILDYVEKHDARGACDRLIALTLERGAIDNVTVVVVRCQPNDKTVLRTAAVTDSA
jgi:protein phosphatase